MEKHMKRIVFLSGLLARMLRTISAAAIGLLACTSASAGTSQTRWVEDSWVSVYSTGSEKSVELGHLTTNRKITIVKEDKDWCEIDVDYGEMHGYLKCKSLAMHPLTLTDLGPALSPDGSSNPAYSATKAFWIEPSAPHLLAAGEQFWRIKLTEEEQNSEHPQVYDNTEGVKFDWDHPPKPKRFSIPEFDAMKALLQAGVVAPESDKPSFASWSDLVRASSRQADSNNYLYMDPDLLKIWQQVKQPPVKPSWFKSRDEIGSDNASVDELSAQFGIKYRMKILGAAVWVWPRNEDPRVAGSWDVGSYALSLDTSVVEHVIGRQGLISAKVWKGIEQHDIAAEAEESCDDSFALMERGTDPIPDYPQVKDPLIIFYVPHALPFKKAAVKKFAQQLTVPASGNQEAGYVLVVTYVYDLDGDNIGDLAAMEFSQGGEQGDTVGSRLTFVNIAGQWYLMTAQTVQECT